MKERTREYRGSRRKSAAACRKVSFRAKVAWRKRNLFSIIRTQGDCGPRKELPVAGREMTHRAKVTRRKGNFVRNKWTKAKAERANQRVGPLRKKVRTHNAGKRGTKALCGKRPIYLRKKTATAIGTGGWSSGQLSPLRRRRPTYKTLKRTTGAGDREVSSRDFQRLAKNQELGLVEGSTSSETKKKSGLNGSR
jgi:hypothetical protein